MPPHLFHPTPPVLPHWCQQCHPTGVTHRLFPRVGTGVPLGTREVTTHSVTLSWCHPVFGVPSPPHGPRRSRTCTSPLQPSPDRAGQLSGGTVTVTVTVTHSTPSWPGLLHGDIVPARMSLDGCGGRPGGAAPGTDSGSSAGRRAQQCGQCTGHPQGTSDSMGTHDQVLGFLTQRGWWQQVAWPDCRTLLSVWLWR